MAWWVASVAHAPTTALDRVPTIPDPSPMQEAPGPRRQASAPATPRTLRQRQPSQDTLSCAGTPPEPPGAEARLKPTPPRSQLLGQLPGAAHPLLLQSACRAACPLQGPPAAGGAQPPPPNSAMQPGAGSLQDSTPSPEGPAVGGVVPSPAGLLPGISVADMRRAYERAHGRDRADAGRHAITHGAQVWGYRPPTGVLHGQRGPHVWGSLSTAHPPFLNACRSR